MLIQLKSVVNSLHYRPSTIAITEVKHKTIMANNSEFSINGYKMYHNDFEKFPCGIIVYVDCRLKSKQLFLNSKAVDHLIIEIQSEYARLVLTTCTYYGHYTSLLCFCFITPTVIIAPFQVSAPESTY